MKNLKNQHSWQKNGKCKGPEARTWTSELDEKVDQIEVDGMSREVIRHVAVDQMM